MAQAPSKSLFFHLPLGIPNPEEEYVENTKEARARVAVEYLEPTRPAFVAIDRLRIHVGTHPNNRNHPKREFEARFVRFREAARRADLIAETCDIPDDDLCDEGICNYLQSITIENVDSEATQFSIAKCSELLPYLFRLTTQFKLHPKFMNCLDFVWGLHSPTHKFLKANGIDAKEEVTKLVSLAPNKFLPWNKRHRVSQRNFEICVSVRTVAMGFGLRPSPWNKRMPFDQFTAILQKEGPLMVLGPFGKEVFGKPQKLGMTVENTPLYGWSLNSKKAVPQGDFDMIIVGCEPRNCYVYFVEADECNDPQKPPRTCVMSYSRLTTYVTEFLSHLEGNALQEVYGYHGPRKEEEEEEKKEN